MNRVLLVGRLVRDPDVQTTSSNVKYARFTIAVDRPFINSQTNEAQTDFIPVVTWRNQADFMEKYLDKGSLISVEGYFSTSTYQNASNQTVWRYEVTADRISSLESRKQAEERRRNQPQSFDAQTKESQKQELQFEEEEQQKTDEEQKKEESVPWELDLD